MARPTTSSGTHETKEVKTTSSIRRATADPNFKYTFNNFFHPFLGELIHELNKESLRGLLDATFHEELRNDSENNPAIASEDSADFFYDNFGYRKPEERDHVTIEGFPPCTCSRKVK